MHLALVAPFLHPHVGGVESHVDEVAAELATRGHRVRILTSRLPGTPRRERRRGYEVERVATAAELFTTPITPRLRDALLEGPRADLVHTHAPPPLSAWYAARAARRMGVPHVYTHHCDLDIPFWFGPAVVGFYRRTLERWTIASAARVVATTRTYAQTSRSLWRRQVDVVPNPVDPDRFRPENSGAGPRERHSLGDRPVALFVGRLTHHKGIEEFLGAAEHTDPRVVHLVVGDGPRRDRYEALARRFEPGKVVFAGRVAHRDLPSYHAAADLLSLPSVSRLEAFGIAALEAMATARPVVVSNIPGVTELVEDGENGLLADPVNAADLAAKIDRLALDPEASRAMGKRARERVLERFTRRRVVDALETVYQAALAGR